MRKDKAFWDKQAEKFDQLDLNLDKESEKLINQTKNYLEPGGRLLDFGCATGNKAIALANSVKYVHGLDFSSGMIDIAKKKAEEIKIENIEFSQGTIYKNDFPYEYFDAVVSYSVLHLLKDLDPVLRKIHELIKPGGKFISVSACFKEKMKFRSKLNVWKFKILRSLRIMPLYLNLFTMRELEQKIKDAGFEIVKSEKFISGFVFDFIVAKKV